MKPGIYQISEGIQLQVYTNNSIAYLSERCAWLNIPKELGEKLIKLKQ